MCAGSGGQCVLCMWVRVCMHARVCVCVLSHDCIFPVICDIFRVIYCLYCDVCFNFIYFLLCVRWHSNFPNGMNKVFCILPMLP